MNSERNKRITVVVFVLLILAIIVLMGVIMKQRSMINTNEEVVTEADNTESQNNENSESNGSDDNITEYEQSAQNSVVYEVKQNVSASWEQDGKYVAQFDVTFRNNSAEPVSDWKLAFANVGKGEILTGWNGKFEIRDGELIIEPESYNGTIEANNAMDCGVQIKFEDEGAVDKVSKDGELYIAGDKIETAKLSADDGGKDEGGNSDEKDNSNTYSESSSEVNVSKTESGTPYDNHGTLSVKGTDIVDMNGEKYQLKGVSTHGLAWFPDYVNKNAFESFRDDWGANVVRLAMYTDENGGYCTDGNKENLKKLVKSGIDEATNLGMYVIVDWHILHDLTPLKYEDEAKKFFEEISSEYKNNDNIIYEICNEPNGDTQWADIKKYAEDIIPVIRKNDSNAVVVVGTPNWSQDVDVAANDPITGYDNVMYTLHFYAATHKDDLREKLTVAKNAGLPIFITEFSICEASGNGQVDYDSAKAWFDLINENNLSYCAWNVSNKDEKSSLIKSGVNKTSGWTEEDLSETGVWIKKQMR